MTRLQGQLTLTIDPFIIQNATHPGNPPIPKPVTHRRGSAAPVRPPLLLLIRTTLDSIGPIPLDLAASPAVTMRVPGSLAESLLPAGPQTVPVAEWRLDSPTKPVPQLPWPAFPAAAEDIADWIIAQSAAHRGHVVLIATRIPQELAVGLGIHLGQRRHDWPSRSSHL